MGRVITVALKFPVSVWIPPPELAPAGAAGLGVAEVGGTTDGFGVGVGVGDGDGLGEGEGLGLGEGEGVNPPVGG